MDRIAHLPLSKLWIGVAIAFLAVSAAAEYGLRRRGFRPSVVDSPDLWAYHRDQIESHQNQLVMVGASRIRLGFVPHVFAESFPNWRISNLALDGRHPVASLRDLANDANFHGTVVCSITTSGIDSTTWNDQQSHVEHAKRASLVGPTNAYINAVTLQQHLAIFGQQLDWRSILTRLLRRIPVAGPPLVNLPDRSGRASYGEEQRPENPTDVFTEAAAVNDQRWKNDAHALAEIAAQITDRGGRVIFVRFPESGSRWTRINERFPKAYYWDYFASLTPSTTIHFQDYPSLNDFVLPDESHLNYVDAKQFTENLIDIAFKGEGAR